MSRVPRGSSICLFAPAIIRRDNIGYYDAVTIPIKKDRNVEKTHTRTLAVSRAGHPGHPVLSSTKKISSSPMVAFSLSTSTHTAANLQVRQIQNGVHPFFTSLLSLSFSPITPTMEYCYNKHAQDDSLTEDPYAHQW